MRRLVQSAVRQEVPVVLLALWVVFLPHPSAAAGLTPAAPTTADHAEGVPASVPGAAAVSGAHPGPLASPRMTVDADYRLSAGDVVQVVVFGEPTLSGSFRIGPGGSIAVPMLGQITLRGLRLGEAEELLTRRAGTIVRRPDVTLTVDETASVRKVYVSGELTRTGAVTLPFGSTLTDAISIAGPGPFADLREVRLTHPGAEPIVVDCSGLRGEGPLGHEHRLEYGDTVFVPRVREEITVMGEVRAPGSALLPTGRRVTVIDALRMSQGFTPLADRSRAVLLRDGAEPILIDLDRLLKRGDVAENREMRGGDVLVVLSAEHDNVLMMGALARTGVFNLRGQPQRDLMRAITLSGPGAATDLERVTVYRGDRALVRNLRALMEEGDLAQNLDLEAGDIVFVPARQVHSVLVSGAVGRRGVMQIARTEDHDLLRVVTLAGPDPASDLTRVTVYRGEETFVRNLKAALEDGRLEESMMVEDGDVVYVPEQAQTLVVSGAVQRSGMVRILTDEWRDLATLINMSGPLPIADLSRVEVHRGDEQMVVDVRSFMDKGDRRGTMRLDDGDVVRVPRMEESILLTGALSRGGVIRLYEGFDRDLTALIMAAGPLPTADLERVTVHRGEERIVRNIRALAEEGDRSQDLELVPGDIISVPMRQVHNVLLTGAVVRAGLMQVVDDQRRDLARLVTLAGPLPNADLSQVTVHRGGLSTSRDIKAYLDSGLDIHTLLLEDGDVVQVPRGEHMVLVTGAVMRAGTLQLVEENQRDLLRVVTLAGPMPAADLSQVTVYRGEERLVRDLRRLTREGDLSQTMLLQDGDIVRVPAYEDSILLAGAVTRYGVLGLGPPDQRDLARLVIAAGPLPQADLRRVTVHRGDESLTRDIRAYTHDGDRTQTLDLEDGDLVLVPVDRDTAMLTGAVTRAGAVGVADPEQRDLGEILTAAGPLPTADLRRVVVFRDETEMLHDFSGLRDAARPTPSVELLPGDRVFVPGLKAAAVLITGAVGRQGTMELAFPHQRDLAKAVMAAAPHTAADLSRVTLHRDDETAVYDVRAYLEQGDRSQTTALEDGDRILVPELGAHGIMITGQVARPGALPATIGRRPDLLGAVTLAGPFPQTADLTRVTVYRRGEQLVRDLKRLREEGDLGQNLELEPGDLVFVPEATETVVFLGEVQRPGAVNIHGVRQRDLARLLPLAGLKPDAGLDRVRIYRQGEVFVRDYRALSERGELDQNIELEPGDLVYVPPDDAHYIIVLGAVNRTGLVNVREEVNRDLLRIVTLMGPLATADLSRVTIYRGDQEPIYRDLQLLRDEGDLEQTMRVEPGDVVVVPKLDEMYILGAVGRAAPYPVQPGWTIMDAISYAGGVARGAESVTLIRRRPDGSTEHIKFDLRRLAKGDPPEPVRVRAGDILYVPAPRERRTLWRSITEGLGILGLIDRIFEIF